MSVDTGERFELFCVDFLKVRSFVVDGMEKDLIFPRFCWRKGELIIQGFDVLDMFSLIRYLTRRFGYKETSFIRQGEKFFDMKTRRWRKIPLGEKRKNGSSANCARGAWFYGSDVSEDGISAVRLSRVPSIFLGALIASIHKKFMG